MKPKEKAIELCDKMMQNTLTGDFAIKCALVAVDEIIKEAPKYEYGHPILVSNRIDYWNEVKQEIKKL